MVAFWWYLDLGNIVIRVGIVYQAELTFIMEMV